MNRSTDSRLSAMQMLVWALEEIENLGNKKAEHHVRLALAHLEEAGSVEGDGGTL